MKIMKFLLFAASKAKRYMLLSSPSQNMVFFVKLNNVEEESLDKQELAVPMFSVPKPYGIAVDQSASVLYVAEGETGSIIGAPITVMADGSLGVVGKTEVKTGTNAVWLSCDSQGNLFYSSPQDKRLMMIDADSLHKLFFPPVDDPNYKEKPIVPVELYASTGTPPIKKVQTPHGIFVDNFHLYWVNGNSGEGVVIRGLEKPSEENKENDIEVIQKAGGKGFGICGSPNGLYYTTNGHVFGAKRIGKEESTVISKALLQPRGCSWDGSGTVWVNDKSGKVYRFPVDIFNPDVPKEIIMHVNDPHDLTLFYSGSVVESATFILLSLFFSAF